MRTALRVAQLTPANIPLIYNLDLSDFAPSPFGRLLFATNMAVEKILRRNVGLNADLRITSADAHYWTFDIIWAEKTPSLC